MMVEEEPITVKEDRNVNGKPKFSLAHKDEAMTGLVATTDKQTLAVWAADCAGRVMPYFEEKFPDDPRPRHALEALHRWIETGVFRMADIRKAALDSHAAAREVGEDNPARSAARAAGQAVSTTHVRTHSIAASRYAQQAVFRAAVAEGLEAGEVDAAVAREREWQYRRLVELREKGGETEG
ncbi:hypothetical protein AZH53_04095 [Methanomicrobiaceae archaeon CYW5]|uniref:putative immunity protein n=1 Tax=Methanovulcanius yangii TaxID=1789227 RepID=UPI0029CA7C1C|nr:hypothetical protein [Methanovulcanius yangii]MBT8507600.1 hypothetical protein [Methanovulcanius yangii]